MEEKDLEREFLLHFHGINYIVTLTVFDGSMISIEAEQEDTNERWAGEFSGQYLEEITNKTGNFKKFGVFVKMLMTALTRESDSVYIDLLTYADLEMLKARKTGQALVNSSLSSNPKSNMKRYLILTYTVEFDRVHYPLPLLYEESPNPNALQRTIKRLRKEVETLRDGELTGTDGSRAREKELKQIISQLRQENTQIRHKLRLLESRKRDEQSPRPSHKAESADKVKRQNEKLRREILEVRTAYEKLRNDSSHEIRRLRETLKGAGVQGTSKDRSRSRSRRVEELETERTNMRHEMTQLRLELSDLKRRLGNERQSHKTLNRRSRPGISRSPVSSRNSSPRSGRVASPTSSSLGKRFDPTAYQRDKANKLQNRKMSVSPSNSLRNSGYSSQGSANSYGYSSTGSKRSQRSAGSNSSRASRRNSNANTHRHTSGHSPNSRHSHIPTRPPKSKGAHIPVHPHTREQRKQSHMNSDAEVPAHSSKHSHSRNKKRKGTQPQDSITHTHANTHSHTHPETSARARSMEHAWMTSSHELLLRSSDEARRHEVQPRPLKIEELTKTNIDAPPRGDEAASDLGTLAEISDIDQRILALQTFLDRARTHILADITHEHDPPNGNGSIPITSRT